MYKVIENFFPGEGATINTLYRDGIVTPAYALKIADLKNEEINKLSDAHGVAIEAWYDVVDERGALVHPEYKEEEALEPDYDAIPF